MNNQRAYSSQNNKQSNSNNTEIKSQVIFSLRDYMYSVTFCTLYFSLSLSLQGEKRGTRKSKGCMQKLLLLASNPMLDIKFINLYDLNCSFFI